MNIGTVIKILVGMVLVTAVGTELGILQRAFDSRSIVEDGVVGADFWLLEVDGNPTNRIQHSFVISKVPFALIERGDRVMELSNTPRLSNVSKLIRFRAHIQKSVNYRIETDVDGSPKLVAK